jgi:hypothetical protein
VGHSGHFVTDSRHRRSVPGIRRTSGQIQAEEECWHVAPSVALRVLLVLLVLLVLIVLLVMLVLVLLVLVLLVRFALQQENETCWLTSGFQYWFSYLSVTRRGPESVTVYRRNHIDGGCRP